MANKKIFYTYNSKSLDFRNDGIYFVETCVSKVKSRFFKKITDQLNCELSEIEIVPCSNPTDDISKLDSGKLTNLEILVNTQPIIPDSKQLMNLLKKSNSQEIFNRFLGVNIHSIRFYRATGEYGFLSNLYPSQIQFEDKIFPTAEHAYQYGKFRDNQIADWVMTAPKTHLVAIISHGIFAFDITPDWNSKKVERMKAVVRAKFGQNAELNEKLIATSGKTLIEDSKSDAFWGIGKKGKGRNWLGTILMQVREELK